MPEVLPGHAPGGQGCYGAVVETSFWGTPALWRGERVSGNPGGVKGPTPSDPWHSRGTAVTADRSPNMCPLLPSLPVADRRMGLL
jgi:hypothetical protein